MDKTMVSSIVIDGHDGAGKTTLAKLLARELHGIYVRPFKGETGVALIATAENRDYEKTIRIGQQAIQKICASFPNELLIFDRHWMTVFSLVPPKFWSKWSSLPPTTLCWIDLETTRKRLNNRPEKQYDDLYHDHYQKIYAELGQTYDCHILRTDTTSIQKSLADLVEWVNGINFSLYGITENNRK